MSDTMQISLCHVRNQMMRLSHCFSDCLTYISSHISDFTNHACVTSCVACCLLITVFTNKQGQLLISYQCVYTLDAQHCFNNTAA
jgi:hypothetical protein